MKKFIQRSHVVLKLDNSGVWAEWAGGDGAISPEMAWKGGGHSEVIFAMADHLGIEIEGDGWICL